MKEQWATGGLVYPDPTTAIRQEAIAHATANVIKEILELESTDLRNSND